MHPEWCGPRRDPDDSKENTEMGNTRSSGSRIKRGAAGVALAATVAAGGLTVAAFNPLASAGAQDGATTSTTSTTAAPPAPKAGGASTQRSKVVHDALASLVADHTLTQAQADAVQTRLQETARTLRGHRRERRQDLVATAASALGIPADDLRTELRSGKTVAQVAEAHGVDVGKVTGALVAEADKLIDQAVTDGTIDQARAGTLKERAATRIQRFVEQGGRRMRAGG